MGYVSLTLLIISVSDEKLESHISGAHLRQYLLRETRSHCMGLSTMTTVSSVFPSTAGPRRTSTVLHHNPASRCFSYVRSSEHLIHHSTVFQYYSSGLPSGRHTLKLTNVSPGNTDPGPNGLELDTVSFASWPDSIVSPGPSSGSSTATTTATSTTEMATPPATAAAAYVYTSRPQPPLIPPTALQFIIPTPLPSSVPSLARLVVLPCLLLPYSSTTAAIEIPNGRAVPSRA